MNGTVRDERTVLASGPKERVAGPIVDERLRHAWWRHLHDVQVAEINRVIARHSPADVLEIAPGPAPLAPELRGVKRGLILESSAQGVDGTQGRPGEVELANAWDVVDGGPFDIEALDRKFDFVFALRWVRHFSPEERGRIYRQVAARLRQGGYFLLDVANRVTRARLDLKAGRLPGLDAVDATYLGRADIRAELDEYGFDLVRLTSVLNHFELQSWISDKLGDRFFSHACDCIRGLDRLPATHPLEWVALFYKR